MTRTPVATARTAALTVALLAPAGLAGLAGADVVQSTWTGADDLNWTNPLNWSPSTFFPNNGAGGDTYLVFIDSAPGTDSLVELAGNVTVSGLTVDLGDRVDVGNNADLRLAGDAANDGVIELMAGLNVTELFISAPVVTLGGSGELRLTDSTLDRITGSVFGNRLVHGAGHTIRGGGSIGMNIIDLDNLGLIEATDGLTMIIDPTSNANVNAGTLRATNGGTLVLRLGAFDGTGGLIEATAGSKVRFEGGAVTGGTLSTTGDGLILAGSGNATLADVVNLGLIEVENNRDLDLDGPIVNDGTIRTAADINATEIRIGAADVTLDGAGELVLGGDASLDRVTGTTFGFQLTNGSSHTIRGGGVLGANVIDIVNDGLVVADAAGSSLAVDPTATLVNNGTMRAGNGSVLRLRSGTYENNAGLVEAEDGAEVELAGATILGGDLQASGTGIFRVGSGNALLQDVDIAGLIEVPNNLDLNLLGTIVNEGTIRTAAGINVTEIRLGGTDLFVEGSGEMVLGGETTLDRITGSTFGSVLVNGSSHTIRGGGLLGVNVIDVDNLGLVLADDPDGSLDIDPTDTFVNTGTIRAASGSMLRLQAGTFQNDGGRIEVEDGGELELAGATIVDGDVETVGTGIARVGSGNTLFEDVTFLGELEIGNNRDLDLVGTIVNDGTIRSAADINVTEIRIRATDVTLAGSGEIVLGGTGGLDRLTGTNFGTLLTNGPGHTIRGGGLMGLNVIDILNQGQVIADDPSDPFAIDATSSLVNEGLMRVLDGTQMSVAASDYTQAGNLEVDAGGAFSRNGTIVQTAGTTIVEGVMTMTNGALDLQGGSLRGTGTVVGEVVNGGFVQPGAAEDFAVGVLTVDEDYGQVDTGTLFIQVGKAGHDQLEVTGTATLGGSLLVGFEKNFTPVIGTQYVIINATDVQGEFIFANCPAGYVIDYGDEQVSITIAEGISIADLDCNGVVDFDDLLLLLPEWGPCPGGGVPCRADVDASGVVDFNDLLILLGAWT